MIHDKPATMQGALQTARMPRRAVTPDDLPPRALSIRETGGVDAGEAVAS